MTIEIKAIRFYTCKCGYEWTNWDGEGHKEGQTPRNCRSCRNVRWNQYKDNGRENNIIEMLKAEHKIAEIQANKYPGMGGLVTPAETHIEFVAYDFLYNIRPLPELFELSQALGIKDLEKRHDFMIEIICDRLVNVSGGQKVNEPPKRVAINMPDHFYDNRGVIKRVGVLKKCKHKGLMELFRAVFSYYYHPRHMKYKERFDQSMQKLEKKGLLRMN